MFAENIPYPAAFIAGLFSFFSPCILPLIPAYFTFITGYSLEELTDTDDQGVRRKVVFSTAAYVAGFSFVFILLGASASCLGGFLYKYKAVIRIIGGMLIIFMGIHITGIFRIRFLDFEKRSPLVKKPLHAFGTFFVGMAFGIGWSPCIGPLLGSILVIAGSQGSVSQGTALLAIYSSGLAIPFIILSIFIPLIIRFVKKTTRIIKYVNTAAGILLILIGLLLLSNKLNLLAISL